MEYSKTKSLNGSSVCEKVGFLQQSGDLCVAIALFSTLMILENLRCVKVHLRELKMAKFEVKFKN